MAFPVVTDRVTGTSPASNATTYTATMPPGSGGLLLVVVSADTGGTLSIDTGYSGANWNQLGQAAYGVTVTSNVYWKIAEGGDQLRLNYSLSRQYSHVALRISGATSVAGMSSNGNSASPVPPTYNEGAAAADNLFVVARTGDFDKEPTAPPANYENLTVASASGFSGVNTATAEYMARAVGTNPSAFTNTSEQWVCWTLAVQPSAPGSGPYGGPWMTATSSTVIDDPSATHAWVSPDNVRLSDDADATVLNKVSGSVSMSAGSGQTTDCIRLSGWAVPGIPTSAEVVGVEVDIEGSTGTGTRVTTPHILRIVDNSGFVLSSNFGSDTVWLTISAPTASLDMTTRFGDAGSTFGMSITAANVPEVALDFALKEGGDTSAGHGSALPNIDSVMMRFTFSDGEAPPPPARKFSRHSYWL